jgi:hypothetical protein
MAFYYFLTQLPFLNPQDSKSKTVQPAKAAPSKGKKESNDSSDSDTESESDSDEVSSTIHFWCLLLFIIHKFLHCLYRHQNLLYLSKGLLQRTRRKYAFLCHLCLSIACAFKHDSLQLI